MSDSDDFLDENILGNDEAPTKRKRLVKKENESENLEETKKQSSKTSKMIEEENLEDIWKIDEDEQEEEQEEEKKETLVENEQEDEEKEKEVDALKDNESTIELKEEENGKQSPNGVETILDEKHDNELVDEQVVSPKQEKREESPDNITVKDLFPSGISLKKRTSKFADNIIAKSPRVAKQPSVSSTRQQETNDFGTETRDTIESHYNYYESRPSRVETGLSSGTYGTSAFSEFSEVPEPKVKTPPRPASNLIPGVDLDEVKKKAASRMNHYNQKTKPSSNGTDRKQKKRRHESKSTNLPSSIAAEEERRVKFKLDVSDAVCSRLNKYFKDGKVKSKEDFKHLSRKITHQILEKEKTNIMNPSIEKKIVKYVDNFISKRDSSKSGKEKMRKSPSGPKAETQ